MTMKMAWGKLGILLGVASLLWSTLVGGAAAQQEIKIGFTISTSGTFARAAEPVLALTACAVGGLLVSPVSWTHHWTWCVPILVLAGYYAAAAWRRDRALSWWSGAVVVAGLTLFIVGPMWFAPRPASSVAWWLATESYELYALPLLALAAFGARRLKAVNATFTAFTTVNVAFTD